MSIIIRGMPNFEIGPISNELDILREMGRINNVTRMLTEKSLADAMETFKQDEIEKQRVHSKERK